MSFRINLGDWGSIFAVPSAVVDRDLKVAGVYQLKVLLYLLRNGDKELTYEKIGEDINISTEDVKDSIMFWIDRGLLAKGEKTLSPAQSAEQAAPTIETEKPAQPRPLTRQPRPDIRFVSQRLLENPALAALMDEAQNALQKPLSSGDICTLYMLSDTYGLPPEVILMLIEYSVSVDKANMHFIEKEGIRWSDEGVNSIEAAEEKITSLKNRYSAWGTVSAVFGLKSAGSPSKSQLAFAECWLNEWNFSTDMLREAYERCVDSKGICDFKYINGILKNWYKKGVKIPADIVAKDAPTRKGKTQGKSASYDIDELDQTSFFDD